MTANPSAFAHYCSTSDWCTLPASPQALGEITDENNHRMFSIAFSTHRDIITEIGYLASDACPAALRACTACICELAQGQAVMAAELLGPEEIAGKLTDDGTLEDQHYYYAILAALCLKNAIASYAEYRKNDLKVWKAANSQTT